MLIEKKLFNHQASEYENEIFTHQDRYPFAGYFEVINKVSLLAIENNFTSVLDLGVGTGLMLSRLKESWNFEFVGCDYSDEMLTIARRRLNHDQLYQHDIREAALPFFVEGRKFDMVHSAYTFHHLTSAEKLQVVKNYSTLLNAKGKFIIADISFDNLDAMNTIKEIEGENWDHEEEAGYFLKNDFMRILLDNQFEVTYTKISFCAGLYEIGLR